MRNRTQLAADILGRLKAAEEAVAKADGELEAALAELESLRERLAQSRYAEPSTDQEAGELASGVSAMTARAEVLDFRLRGLSRAATQAREGLDGAVENELPVLAEMILEREAELRAAAAEAVGQFCIGESNIDFVVTNCGRIRFLNGLAHQVDSRFHISHDMPDVLRLIREFLEPLAGAADEKSAAPPAPCAAAPASGEGESAPEAVEA